MRERDAQFEHKKKKQEAAKEAEQKYIHIQEEVPTYIIISTTIPSDDRRGREE